MEADFLELTNLQKLCKEKRDKILDWGQPIWKQNLYIYRQQKDIDLKIEHLKTVLYLFAWKLNLTLTGPDQTRPEGKEEDQKL